MMRQVWSEKANDSEPSTTRRKALIDIKTGNWWFSREWSGRHLFTALSVSGV